MLRKLNIQNFTLIDELNIDFTDGLTVITGETGSGKSILLGALSLILGNRVDSQSLLDKKKKCIVEAEFYIKDYGLESFFKENDLDFEESTIIRREINQQGNSRAFINDTPVNLSLLKEFSEKLIDIHSQHKTLILNNSGFQLEVIDQFAQHTALVKQYKSEYVKFKLMEKELNDLCEKEKKSKAEQDFLQFQFNELEAAQLKDGELDQIEKDLEILIHSEEIKKDFFLASQLLINNELNLLGRLKEVKNLIQKFVSFHPDIHEFYERLNSCSIELQDISKEVDKFHDNILFDPERMQLLSTRRDVIFRLMQKYHINNINELIDMKESISDKILDITSMDERILHLKKELQDTLYFLLEKAKKNSISRKKVIPKIEQELTKLLSQLGMPDGRVKIQCNEQEISINGLDNVTFLFTANKGIEPRELSKVASGGELSRLMLSIKSLISQRNMLPTIIFDEIDMGVSGNIANKMGVILRKMSTQMQLIVITHLPQIAGKGDIHYQVFKQNVEHITRTLIRKLNNEQRVEEISKMLSGDKTSQAASQTARELLDKS